jgi:hypothetical protein
MRLRRVIGLASLTLIVAAAASCGQVIRSSRSPVQLLVNSITSGSSGALLSDVISSPECAPKTDPITLCPTVLDDTASASLSAVMKDATVTPTTNNQVTITRYYVLYRRADGRNTPGVDVPFPFYGAVTATIAGGGNSSVLFELVRHSAKLEPPLIQLRNSGIVNNINNPNIISTITDVTFYGTDLVGNDVSATGSITVNFADFADAK